VFLTASLLAASLADAAVVGPGVYKALEKRHPVRVIASIDPGVPFDFSTPEALQIFETAVRLIVDDVLGHFLPGEFTLYRRFQSINALAGDVNAAGLARLVADPRVQRIDLDRGGRGSLVEARALARIDPVLSSGFTGQGVTVAVLDSGVDAQHPDLLSSVSTEQCFCSGNGGCCPNGTASQSGPGSAHDDNGHGTNVAGIITSDGTVAPRGAAPDAEIIAVKVLASDNSFCCSSDILAGLDWVKNQHPEVKAINLSLGTVDLFSGDCDNATSYTSSYATAVNALRAQGVLVFASSGNNRSSSMAAPACVSGTISVGAVYDGNNGSMTFPGVCTDATTRADQVTCFSNSDAKTDLFAPGAVITSTGLGGGTSNYMGTSQASPMALACAADLLQAYPDLTPDRLEAALERSPTRVTDPKNGLSFPRLDCQTALAVVGPDLSFYPVTPCRVLDTRNGTGPVGGPALRGGSARVFPIVGSCGIPSSARAVSINVTAIDPPVTGEIVLYPGNMAAAPNTSTISLMPGLTRANHAVLSLALDGDGTLSALARIASGSQVNLVVDVDGYYDQP
jgi:subtilisin family serine protease